MSVEMEWLGGNDYFAKAPNRAGIKITWIDHGREMKCPADSDYPNGQDIDLGAGAEWTCLTELPYPAPRCGQWKLECQKCGLTALVTAAGRPDDPRSISVSRRGANDRQPTRGARGAG
jgi:hypothetical protein